MKIAIGGIRGIPARYGGFETSVEETAKRMQALGHQVTVYCRSKSQKNQQSEYLSVKLIYLRVTKYKSLETILHSIAIGFHVAFNRRNYDVVHLYNAASAFGGIIVWLIGKPLIITLDGIEWEREKWGRIAKLVWKIATWLSMHVSDTTICDSQTVRTIFEKRYGTKIQYIPYGAKHIKSISDDYKTFGLEHRNYFIFVGRLVPEKGVDCLLEAYNICSTCLPLVIVGDNEDDPEYVRFLHRQAGKNVKFLGYRYGNEYESLLAHSYLYITASKLEGTSPSLLAAMGAHVCCLVNSIQENRETGGDSVVYFNGSPQDLAAKWDLLLKHPEIVDEFAEKGYQRVKSHYDWDIVTDQYLDFYSRV